VSGQIHAPAALPPRKKHPLPLGRRSGGLQSRSGRLGEEKILDPTGTRTPTSSVVQFVASRCIAIPDLLVYMYIKYIQGYCQSGHGATDHALSHVARVTTALAAP
jgi:hypothetical protein